MTDDFKWIIGMILIACLMITLSVSSSLVDKVKQQKLIISGQEATIASYKESLTGCLKDTKLSTQDEFTGE